MHSHPIREILTIVGGGAMCFETAKLIGQYVCLKQKKRDLTIILHDVFCLKVIESYTWIE